MNTHDNLVAMINQIARNFAISGDDAAATATAEHLRLFWAPQMRAAVTADDAGLTSIARAAVRQLGRDGG